MLFYFFRSGFSVMTVIEVAIFFASLLIALTVHEFSHALAADKLGDPTAKMMGRLSLNPRAHLDPIGTLMILFTGFGWGKPVPFNPLYLESPRRDSALISFAGPISNIITAIIIALPYRLGLPIFQDKLIFELIITAVSINIGLAVFNLLPIYPLDGFRIVGGLLPPSLAPRWEMTASYGIFFLLFLVFIPSNFSLINGFVIPLSRTLLNLILGNSILLF